MKKCRLLLMLLMVSYLCDAKVVLPSLLCDNMVLQRNAVVKLWGEASPLSTVIITVSWDSNTYETAVGKDGQWSQDVVTTEAGGPYSITISDGTPIVLSNILLGEVWICAGQSNMEMPVQGFFGQPCIESVETMRDAKKYPDVRMFTVARSSQKVPQSNCSGEWLCPDPESGHQPAVGQFL